MVQNSEERVYRKDWGFRMRETEGYFPIKTMFIQNDDIYGSEEHDYIDIEDFTLCIEIDDVLFQAKHTLLIVLEGRIDLEDDITYSVVVTFLKSIYEEWYKSVDWGNLRGIVKSIESGKYDDEMNRYYAYLQAKSVMENIDLIDFSDDWNIDYNLEDNNIYVYDDDIFFRTPGVEESVERSYDLGLDVIRLLTTVMNGIKNTGETIDFKEEFKI